MKRHVPCAADQTPAVSFDDLPAHQTEADILLADVARVLCHREELLKRTQELRAFLNASGILKREERVPTKARGYSRPLYVQDLAVCTRNQISKLHHEVQRARAELARTLRRLERDRLKRRAAER